MESENNAEGSARTLRVLLAASGAIAAPSAVLGVTQSGSRPVAYVTGALWAAIAAGSLILALRPSSRLTLRRTALGQLVAALAAFILAAGLGRVLLGAVGIVLVLFVLALATRPASPRLRKGLLAAHVLCSGSWMGVAAVMVALTLIGGFTDDRELQRQTYKIMEICDQTVLPLASVSATFSGVFMSFVTHWGVLRYRWIVTKLVLALTVFTTAFAVLHDWVVEAAAAQQEVTDGLVILLIGGFAAGFLNVAAAMVISIYKPWGRTRRGRRENERRAKERVARAKTAVS